MMPSGRFKVWRRKWVQNPVVTVVAGAALVWSLFSLPDGGRVGGGESTVGELLADAVPFLRPSARVTPVRVTLYAVREKDTFRILDPNNDSWDEAGRLLDQRPDDVYEVVLLPRFNVPTGFYAPTSLVTTLSIRIGAMGRDAREPVGITRKEIVSSFVEALAWVENGQWKNEAAMLRAGRFEESRKNWPGIIHDILALVVLMVFLYSLAWIPRAPGWLAATRRQRALDRGRCPHCGYAIGGLPEPVCPECGRSWDVTAEDPPVSSAAES